MNEFQNIQHFKNSNVQLIIFDEQGVVLESCDTFFRIDKSRHFSESSVIPAEMFRKNLVCVYPLLDEFYLFQTASYQQANNVLSIHKLCNEPENITDLCLKMNIFLSWFKSGYLKRNSNLDSTTQMLLQSYFEYISKDKYDYLQSKEYVPFKVGHVINALRVCFSELLNEHHVVLSCVQKFNSKFLIGDRLGLLTKVAHALYLATVDYDSNAIELVFDYEKTSRTLVVRLKGDMVGEVSLGSGWVASDEEFKLEVYCDVVGLELIGRSKSELSHADFPYLFNITGGDAGLVSDILQTIMEQVLSDVGLLKQAFEERRWSDLARLTHKLKPNFSSVERSDMADVLQEMEKSALKEDADSFEEKMKFFEPIAEQVITNIRQYQL